MSGWRRIGPISGPGVNLRTEDAAMAKKAMAKKAMAKKAMAKKKSKARARKRVATKDLSAKNAKQVKGGRKSGQGQQDYLVVKMNDVQITGV
jgi:hypothetical protein